MIELRHVTKRYGDFAAVDDLSFSVDEGEVCVIIGPSGCGKSTTLKMMNRMLEPTDGEIFINKRSIREFKPELLRRQMGYVIQYVGLFPHMTVAQNIAVVPKLLSWDKRRIEKRVVELLSLVELLPKQYSNKYPRELSGGEAQRIGVARALAADPPLLLMDEPFGAVDPLNRELLASGFVKIQKELKKTVVFVTHDLDEAVRVADRILIMKNGRSIQHDAPENILARPKNKFVHDFVGSDRALKRLARYSVSRVMRKPFSVRISDELESTIQMVKEHPRLRFLWVLDQEEKLLGWIDTRIASSGKPLKELMTEIPISRIALNEESTLREALSRMLAEGIKVIPVVDRDRRVVGEISLADIEKITEEVSVPWHD